MLFHAISCGKKVMEGKKNWVRCHGLCGSGPGWRGWSFGFNGQGVQALVYEILQGIIHKAMAGQPRLTGKVV